jgi:hypothetical protein
MIIRALTGDHDWTFGQGIQNYLTNDAAIAENIQTRLLSILNDCYFDLGAGVDWIRLLSTKGTQNEIQLSCKAIILASYGVFGVNSIVAQLVGRALMITYNINTIFTTQFTQTIEV